MTKTTFELDQGRVVELAAEKLADECANLDHISHLATDLVRARIDQLFTDKINDAVDKALSDKLEDVLNETIQPVDIFGDKVGEPTTIKNALREKAKDFWGALVDTNGKTVTDGWSRRNAKTRAEWMLGNVVSEEFAAQVKANMVQITAVFKKAMREDAVKMVDRHIDKLIK